MYTSFTKKKYKNMKICVLIAINTSIDNGISLKQHHGVFPAYASYL